MSPENGFASRCLSPPTPSTSSYAAELGKLKKVPSGSASHGSGGRGWCFVAASHGRQTATKGTRSTWDGRRRRTAAAILGDRPKDHGDDDGGSSVSSRAMGTCARGRGEPAVRDGSGLARGVRVTLAFTMC